MKNFYVTYKELFIIIITVLFLFQPFLIKLFSYASYIDECVVCILTGIFLMDTLRRKKMLAKDLTMLMIMILIIFIGCLGNYISKYKQTYIPILIDIFSVFKVFLVFIASYKFMQSNINREKIVRILAKVVRVIVVIACICAIISFFTDIGMSQGEIRFGIKSFSFIYSSPDVFGIYLYLYLFILTLDLKYISVSKKIFRKEFFIVLCLICLASTLRYKAFAYIAVYIFLYLKIIKKLNSNFRVRLIYIILIILMVLPFTYEKIIYYFGENSNTARSAFLVNSFKISSEYFPIGSGFATFGTNMAYKYYSDAYIEFGMNKVWGLSKEFGSFAHDTYWPAILAQFGYIGVILFITMLYIFYKNLFKLVDNKINFLATIFVTYITILSSIATSTYFHFSAVALFFMIPLMYDNCIKEQK